MKKFILSIFAFCLSTFAFAQQYGWKNISANVPGNPDFSDVFFVSDDEGWISVSSGPEIYHTTDGGKTFEIQTTQYPTEAIYMIDETEGYAGGTNGRVYRTTDGGDNWIAIGSIGVTLTDIAFPPNSDTGYACGLSGQIFKVNQSGITNMNSYAGTVNLKSLIFPTKSEGWVCGESLILHFKNETWNADQLYPSGSYNSIFFVNNSLGWAVGDQGLIICTTNGGVNWSTQSNPDSRSLFKLSFLSNTEGWAIGIDGIILHTSNGGNNWDIEGAGLPTAFLRGVHFTSPTNGYVVGNGKTLLKYGEISGIGDNKKIINFEIFPNPTTNKIQIKCSEFKTESGTIEILSMEGKKLLKKEIGEGNEHLEIDVSNLASGVYFCTLKTNKGTATKKLIVQNK